MCKELLRIENLCKDYPGTKALINVNFSVKTGEIHIVLGENGAGKSTMLNILAGAIKKDSGDIYVDGTLVEINSPKRSADLGFCMIYQEPSLVPELTVYENLFLGNEIMAKGPLGIGQMDEKAMIKLARKILTDLNIDLDPNQIINTVGIAQRQFIQLARIYVTNPRIIVIDEITASLNEIETRQLFEILKGLKKAGKSIIYFTPKMIEAKMIGDVVTILKDGREILTEVVDEIMPDAIIKLMLGADLKNRYPKLQVDIGEEVFRVSGMYGKAINNINFTLYKHEILGVAGLLGSGRTNLARTIIGLDKKQSGKVYINSKEVDIDTPLDAINNGLGFISENRNEQGLHLKLSVADNITISNIDMISKYRIISGNRESILVKDLVDRLDIKLNDIKQEVTELSGGNKQKIMIARCLFSNSKIFIFDEPTMGVDTAGKIEIYNIMNELIRRGASIIMISSDFSELVGMCNRILVMKDGTIVREISRDESDIAKLFYYSSGGMHPENLQ